jgi:hypothetical protein
LSCRKDRFKFPPQSNLRIVHALPNASAVDFYIDNTKYTERPLKYAEYTNAYATLGVKHRVDFRGIESQNPLIAEEINLEDERIYTIFYTGTTANPKIVLLKQDSPLPDAGKTRVNFLNLSSENKAINIRLKGGAQVTSLASNYLYSGYLELNSGKLIFEVTDATDNSLLYTLPEFNLESGKIYTIWLKGAMDGLGDNSLGGNLILHNP